MHQPDLSFDCSLEAKVLSQYTVGFADIATRNNAEDASVVGSGTLVTIGAAYGVVTARHVIEKLERKKELALVRFPLKADVIQSHRLDTRELEFLPLPGTDGPDGPDLGFIRLPLVTQEVLIATSSFYPLSAKRPSMKDHYKGLGMCDFVAGVVSEWTTDVELTKKHRVKRFTLMMSAGFSGDEREHCGLDVATFEPGPKPDISPPSSYGGVSGGGVWRIFFKPDGSNDVEHRRLIGTAFYEFDPGDGIKRISHHGYRALEECLVQAVREKWPDAAGPKT